MAWISKFRVDDNQRTVSISIYYTQGKDIETTTIREQLEKARDDDSFEILRSWRDELYLIVGINRDVRMTRGGSALFGIQTIGVHMTGFSDVSWDAWKIPWEAESLPTKMNWNAFCVKPKRKRQCQRRLVGKVSYFLVRDARAGEETGLSAFDATSNFSSGVASERMAALKEGQFKPNSAVVLVDFLIRH
ncbi:MAG: hypothetical protein Q9211_002509 [Gyalolechia sp. 1 TL-2023]